MNVDLPEFYDFRLPTRIIWHVRKSIEENAATRLVIESRDVTPIDMSVRHRIDK